MKHLKALSALALAFVLLVFLSSAAAAQTSLSLSGQVTNDRGEPLAGVKLTLNGPIFDMATADANGAFSFSVPAGNYTLNIHSPDSYDRSVHAPPVYTIDTSTFYVFQTMTLSLQLPFKKLSVHVQDSQGTPVANAVMGADSAQASNVAIGSTPFDTIFGSGQSYYATLHQVVTNATGDADLWLLPTPTDTSYCSEYGTCTYVLTAQPPSGSGLALSSLSDMTLLQDSSVTITLPAGVLLTGSVTDAQGNPLSGLLLTIRSYNLSTGANLVTDASGRYSVSVAPNTFSLRIDNNWDLSKPRSPLDFHLRSDFFEVAQNRTLDLALPFKRVTVHVVDANGQPMAGAILDAFGPSADLMTIGGVSFSGYSTYPYYSSENLKTDANGNATLLLLPVSQLGWSGAYTITAYPPAETGLPPQSLADMLITTDTNLTISYAPPPTSVTLSGRITDADGNGLPNQSINLYRSDYTSEFHESTDGSGHYAFTDAPGYHDLVIQSGVPVGSGLHAAQRYDVHTPPYGINITQDTTLDLALPFKRVNVHVVDANDQPVAGAGLSANADWGDTLTFGNVSLSTSCSYSYDTSTGEGPKTDENGNATLWLLPASDSWGGYSISAYAPSGAELPDTSLYNVLVSGETNVTLRFAGVLPAKVPSITSLSPASVGAGDPSFTLVVNGTNFVKTSVVRWNGADRSTTFVSSTQLTAIIPSTDIASPGTANVTVWTPAPGGGESSALPLTIDTSVPSATINVYTALHATGTGSTSGDKKTPLAMSLKVFDRATFPSAGLKEYASVWNSGPGLISPWARITGPTVTTFSNGPANLYTLRVPATGSANNVTSGRYLVVGKVDGAETYMGAVTDPLAVDSVTDEYFLVDQKSSGQISPAAVTSGTATPTPKATQTPKPKPTSKVVPTNPTPKPTGTPRPTATPKPTVTPKKVPSVPPNAVPTQEPAHATPTPKKPLTATPMATWTMLPTKTPQLTPTPRDKPTKH